MRIALFLTIVIVGTTSSPAQSPVQSLIDDLSSNSPTVRCHAARRLGQAGDDAATDALIDALRDPDRSVRRASGFALGALKSPAAVSALIAALQDADTNVRVAAAYALGEIKDPKTTKPLLHALRDPDWNVRDQAAWALRELRDPALSESLVAMLKSENADRQNAIWLLEHLGGEHVNRALTAMLKEADTDSRLFAVRALGKQKDDERIAPLLSAMNDDSPTIRQVAIKALVESGNAQVRSALQERIVIEQDARVRKMLSDALFELSPLKHLAAWWSFDDKDLTTAKDVTGNGNSGQIIKCEVTEGKVGAALRFTQGSYIELGKPANLPVGQRPFTVMAWIKTDAPDGVVVARGGAFCGYSLYIKDGKPKFGLKRTEEEPGFIAAGAKSIGNDWLHLTGIVHNDRIELVVNGKMAASQPISGYLPGNCGQGMEIGFDAGNSPAEIVDHFQGTIDEVKIYHVALSAEEIVQTWEQP